MSTKNAKKLASHTIDNMILKIEAFLLSKDENQLKEFQKILDRSKREIISNRGKDSDLKRVYSVEMQAKYHLLRKMFGASKINADQIGEKIKDSNWDNDSMFLWKNFSGLDTDQFFSQNQVAVFDDLNEEEMKQNIYLGQDCTPEKKTSGGSKSSSFNDNLARFNALNNK